MKLDALEGSSNAVERSFYLHVKEERRRRRSITIYYHTVKQRFVESRRTSSKRRFNIVMNERFRSVEHLSQTSLKRLWADAMRAGWLNSSQKNKLSPRKLKTGKKVA